MPTKEKQVSLISDEQKAKLIEKYKEPKNLRDTIHSFVKNGIGT